MTSVTRRVSGRSPTATSAGLRDVDASVSVPVAIPVGDSGGISRYQIVLPYVGPTGSGYRPSTGQTIVKKGPLCRIRGVAGLQLSAFRATTDDVGSTIDKTPHLGQRRWAKKAVPLGAHQLLGQPLCIPVPRDSNDGGEHVCWLSPVTAPIAQLQDPTHSTEAIDREAAWSGYAHLRADRSTDRGW